VKRFFILLVMVLSGCAAKPDFNTLVKLEKKIELENLYIYSFLDFREKTIGSDVISDIKKQFDLQFEQRNVQVNQLWYKETSLLTNSSISEEGGEANIPVGQIVNANLLNEQKMDAKYRLIAFPSYVRHGNSNVGYQVRWSLFDATTNERLWTASSWTNNMNWFSRNEMSETRAKVLVQGLMEQLEKAGTIKPLPKKHSKS